ncbi:carbon storage regulator CsrA [Arthrobacter sp. RIT-PI-e]|uniref:carbon storage regulator CsrA n=1 Tax=Arthrobacter sp. RIT-PI-e TaxID=1681197 RepID=UPI000675F437|nr:carbon storage regulator CsrA [Arthrobacter sp. RIT-PI-e]KNC17342.1 carbon storage regulator CsrA [Arthrobacter sp. RIT-PI-e]
MLVLTRKVGEQILIGDDIVITVLDSRGEGVRIGIDAPRGVKIQREEVLRAVTEANLAAAAADAEAADALKALLQSGAVVSTDATPGRRGVEVDPAEPRPADA